MILIYTKFCSKAKKSVPRTCKLTAMFSFRKPVDEKVLCVKSVKVELVLVYQPPCLLRPLVY